MDARRAGPIFVTFRGGVCRATSFVWYDEDNGSISVMTRDSRLSCCSSPWWPWAPARELPAADSGPSTCSPCCCSRAPARRSDSPRCCSTLLENVVEIVIHRNDRAKESRIYRPAEAGTEIPQTLKGRPTLKSREINQLFCRIMQKYKYVLFSQVLHFSVTPVVLCISQLNEHKILKKNLKWDIFIQLQVFSGNPRRRIFLSDRW